MDTRESAPASAGLAWGVLAYVWWGLAPLYWRVLAPVPAADVIAHRALWAVPFCALLLASRGRLRRAFAVLREPRQAALLALCGALLALNWGLFVWAINANRLAEASLGYFMLPLVAVLLGLVFFRERLTGMQWIAIGFAGAGVLVYALDLGRLPLLTLGVAVTFALYGALRKGIRVDPLDGMFIETLLLAPIALGWMLAHGGSGLGVHGRTVDALLLLAGAFTALPLIAYVTAAQRLSMVTVGLLFYVNPSCQLLLAVCVFGEHISAIEAITFALVWTGVLLYLGQMAHDRWRGA